MPHLPCENPVPTVSMDGEEPPFDSMDCGQCRSCMRNRVEELEVTVKLIIDLGKDGDYLCWCGLGKAPKMNHTKICQSLYDLLEGVEA